ncbi:MAG: aminotransferase class V-fold PLP-dependent enzyme [Salinibacterium sp.]|nr:aminotransferase class V-fold PLP-dependent enzyme [Salinibacterium sp.]
MDDFIQRFSEEPGYLDFARCAPIGRTARDEESAMSSLLGRARYGTLDTLVQQDARVRGAVAALTGFRADQVVFQPNTSQGLMHTMFGLTGEVLLSPAEFASNTYAVARSANALGALTPRWLETDHGRVTPGNIKQQLHPSTVAVEVSLVDYRTGYLADLEGIRQVIGDRLLIVDAIQGFGVVDAPYEVADVVVAGGQKWVRAGWGTGFLALSDRAVAALVPVLSGFSGTDAEGTPTEVLPPSRGARAFSISNPDPIAQARFAAALEEIEGVGIPTIAARLAEKVSRIIDLADEFALDVTSSRAEDERAGIVVLAPEPDQLTLLTASLHNHGITSTTRAGSVRLSPHVTTGEDTFTMLRGAFTSFASAINP